MKALRNQPPTLYSPTANLLRLCHPLNLSHMTAPGLRPFHTLHPCVKVPNPPGSGPMGRNFGMLKVESIGDATFANLQRRLRSTAARRIPIELVFPMIYSPTLPPRGSDRPTVIPL